MLQFAAILAKEQPAINNAVKAMTDTLPAFVRPAAAYALDAGGKRLRPFLVSLVARALGCKDNSVYPIGATVEFFHVATLLHDDILDNADTRRGHPATHQKFGVPRTLLTADAMVSRAIQTLADTGNPRYSSCLSGAVIGTVNGEIMEIEYQGRTDGGLDAYNTIIAGKTAFLLRASCELGAICANAAPKLVEAVVEYGHNLGMAFQIADDALDFAPTEKTGKPEGGDVREGKFTPPICFYAESLEPSAREAFLKRFAARDFSDEELATLVRAIREGGFQQRTLRMADAFLDKAAAALDAIKPVDNAAASAQKALEKAVAFVRDRTS